MLYRMTLSSAQYLSCFSAEIPRSLNGLKLISATSVWFSVKYKLAVRQVNERQESGRLPFFSGLPVQAGLFSEPIPGTSMISKRGKRRFPFTFPGEGRFKLQVHHARENV